MIFMNDEDVKTENILWAEGTSVNRTSEDRSFVQCKQVSTEREDTQTEVYL